MFCASEVSVVPSHLVLTVASSLLILVSAQLAVARVEASSGGAIGAVCYYCVAAFSLLLTSDKAALVVIGCVVVTFTIVKRLPKAHEGVASVSLALPLVAVVLAGLVHNQYAAFIALELTSLTTLLIVVTTPQSVNKQCLLSYY